MTEYVHLVGAESVQNAARQMMDAADHMKQAASSMNYAMDRAEQVLQRFEFWAQTLVEHMEKLNASE